MSFKLNSNVMYKEDPNKFGILFSVEIENDKFIKIKDVAKEFIVIMMDGKSYDEARSSILEKYNVTPEVLDKDLALLKEKLLETGFLEK